MTVAPPWQECVGPQRDWYWRGWQTRYAFRPATTPDTRRPPLLFIHGFGAALGHWKHNLPFFSESHRVYALDLLGFGGSEKATENYVITLRADQIYDFWRTFINEPVILVGNSLGSLASLVTAARYPQMVAGLVMINLPDSSVLDSPPGLKPLLTLLKTGMFPFMWLAKQLFTSPVIFNPFFELISQPRSIRFWVSQAYEDRTAVTDELVQLLVEPTCDRNAANALLAMFNSRDHLHAPTYSARTILPNLTLPMLLLWGRQDKLVPPSLGPRFVQTNPNLQLIELDPAGHCPQDECPDVVNAAILNWIQQQEWEQQAPSS